MAIPPTITISSSPPSGTAGKATSSHRLPTRSAASALQELERKNGSEIFISTGLESLDRGLTGGNDDTSLHLQTTSGLERGKVGEIWGSPGAGKTAIAFQTACEAIRGDGKVVWIDCATLLSASKLKLLPSSSDEASESGLPTDDEALFNKFHYLAMPTLSHLLAKIIHPPPNFPPPGTSLLILDNLNTLLDLDFPRTGYTSTRSEAQKWASNRRYSILGSLIASLNKLAVLHNLAVLVTTGCNSKMRPDSGGAGAAIGPGVGGSEWEAGIHTRMVVFRDFGGARFVGIQKVNGRNLMPLDPTGDVRNVIGFEIGRDGVLRQSVVDLTTSSSAGGGDGGAQDVVAELAVRAPVSKAVVRKRVYDEIADSEEDEDVGVDEYGWAERDEEDVIVIDPPVTTETEEQIRDGAQPEPEVLQTET